MFKIKMIEYLIHQDFNPKNKFRKMKIKIELFKNNLKSIKK